MSVAIGSVKPRRYQERKINAVKVYSDLVKQNPYFLIVDITGIPAQTLHGIRRKLRELGATFKVIKNAIFLITIKNIIADDQTLGKIESKLRGQNGIIFTSENPFSLIIFLKKEYRMTRQAKAGDVATSDIVIPAGNTGFSPGPIISLFNKLKIPIRIQEGSIWITSDTVVAKKGDAISAELADFLGKLGLKPIEVSLPIKAIFLDNRIVEPDEIEIDPEIYSKRVAEAHSYALNLALNACIPVSEVMPVLLRKAYTEACSLAIAAALPVPDVIASILARANSEAYALYNLIKTRSAEFS